MISNNGLTRCAWVVHFDGEATSVIRRRGFRKTASFVTGNRNEKKLDVLERAHLPAWIAAVRGLRRTLGSLAE